MDYLTNDTELTAVADAIREKSETTDLLEWPDGFIQAIEDCQTGGPELEWLWGNQITNTLSGTIDSTDDAYAGPILDLGVDGVSTQVTTTGKNLFNPDQTPRGYYNPTTGAFVANNSYVCWSVPVAEGDVIRWSASYDCTPSYWSNGSLVNKGAQGHYGTYTVPTDIDEVRGYCNVNGLSVCVVTKNNADMTYEPYSGGAASPRPDWTQPILSVDDLALTVAGKNMLDVFNDPSNPRKNTSASGNGNQPFQYDSTNDAYYTGNFSRVPIVIPADGTYTLTMTAKKSATTGNYFCHLTNSGYTYSTVLTTVYAQHSWTLTATAGETFTLTIYNTAYVQNIQLELGSTATAYEPYQGHTIPLYDGTLRSLPDGTKDELHLAYLKPSTREGWAWYSRELVRRIGVGTITNGGYTGGEFDTTNGFTLYAPWAVFGITGVNASASTNNIRCDKLQVMTSNDTTKTDVIWAKSSNLVVNLAGYTTQSDANAALRALAPAVYYVLATPVTTQLDPIELPIMPSENATVWCDGGSAQPTFMLEYIQNANIVISRLEDTIADLATS